MKIKYTVDGKDYVREVPKAQVDKIVARELAYAHKARVESINRQLEELQLRLYNAMARKQHDRALSFVERRKELEAELAALS